MKKTQDLEKRESAYKPGSVEDNYSSTNCVTAGLKRPTRIQCEQHYEIPIWPYSEWGLQSRKLLPAARCALTAPFHPYLSKTKVKSRRYIFCCTGREFSLPRCYLAPCSLEPGLSSPHATVYKWQTAPNKRQLPG